MVAKVLFKGVRGSAFKERICHKKGHILSVKSSPLLRMESLYRKMCGTLSYSCDITKTCHMRYDHYKLLSLSF